MINRRAASSRLYRVLVFGVFLLAFPPTAVGLERMAMIFIGLYPLRRDLTAIAYRVRAQWEAGRIGEVVCGCFCLALGYGILAFFNHWSF